MRHGRSLVGLKSDPIYSSDPSMFPKPHKLNEDGDEIVQYPDPNHQGLDEDIINTQKHLENSENWWGVKWNYNTEEDLPNFAIPGKPEYNGEYHTNFEKVVEAKVDEKKGEVAQTTPNAPKTSLAAAIAIQMNNNAPTKAGLKAPSTPLKQITVAPASKASTAAQQPA